MKLCIFTIVLNGQPFIQWQYETLKKLLCDWKWIVVHGAAMNNESTGWCQTQKPRLSSDGTTEYLESIKGDRVTVSHAPDWDSKDQMVNHAMILLKEPCVLIQIDVDELYSPAAIDRIVKAFTDDPQLGVIKMFCRYFVGPNLVCEGQDCWSNNNYEWLRAWRFEPGMRFEKHEPPVMNKILGRVMERQEALNQHALTFDHLAYARREQVAYKEKFYGYDGLLNQWDALQRNTVWPAKLSRFFPFVSGDRPLVRKIG